MHYRFNCFGMTLLELIIGLTIGLLILLAVMTLYITGNKNYLEQSALNSIQENARAAIDLLQTEVSMAGYVGCTKLSPDFPIRPFEEFQLTSDNVLNISPQEIVIRKASTEQAELLMPMQDFSIISVTSHPRFSKNDMVMISDCHAAEIFKIKKSNLDRNGNQQLTSTRPLLYLYQKNAVVSFFDVKTFKIKPTNRRDFEGNNINALYMKNNNLHKEVELVEGINEMQISSDTVNTKVIGVHVKIQVAAVNYSGLKKDWYTYIYLRQV